MISLYKRGGRTRAELLSRTGSLREVDRLVDAAYKILNERDFAGSDQGAAAEDKWHVSFHGSQFPGDAQYACGRASIYRLMDVPRSPFTRVGRQYMDAGKDFEDRLVWAWYQAGFLVSNPPTLPDGTIRQTMFVDPDHWLTSTVDSILVRPRSISPFVAEVKQVKQEIYDDLSSFIMEPHEQYVRQVKCQIGMAHEHGPIIVKRCHNTGAVALKTNKCAIHGHDKCLEDDELEPVNRGYLYYSSRNDPFKTIEFMYEYDPAFMRAGRQHLAEWKQQFLKDELPQTHIEDKRYSHPFGWKWSLPEYPCKWCSYGDICRDDHDAAKERKAPIALHESALVEVAERFREEWDYETVKAAVLSRWGLDGRAISAKAA